MEETKEINVNRIGILIPEDLKVKCAIKCAKKKIKMSDLIRNFLIDWVKENKND